VHGEEHRFCQVCGQLLKRSHPGVRPCARCGTHTLPGQKFCTDCGLPLRVMPAGREEEPMPRSPLFYPRGPEPRPSRRRRRPIMAIIVILALVAAGLVLYILGNIAINHITTAFSGKTQELPVTKTPDLRPEVEKLAEKIRSAHLNKDINKFLSCYSSTYPNLGQLENSVLELWKKYDVKEVNYRISNIQRLGDRQASATLVWSLQLYDPRSNDYQLLPLTYRVLLEKNNGEWKIKESKPEAEPRSELPGAFKGTITAEVDKNLLNK
jgi:hypothetical protein